MNYSLKSSCWSRVDEQLPPYHLKYVDLPGTYLNGSLHWVVTAYILRMPVDTFESLIVASTCNRKVATCTANPFYLYELHSEFSRIRKLPLHI